MNVVALLNFYDEPVSSLIATVGSLHGLCDGVVAVDGAYALFPGALRQPRSGQEQAEALHATATSLGMSFTYHSRPELWVGNEVEKRQFMFRLAETVTTEDDWLFLIDADEIVSQLPPDTRDHLRGARDYLAAECFMWERLDIQSSAQPVSNHRIRRFWRALRGIEVGPAHHQFHVGNKWLSDASRPTLLVSALTLHDVRIEHRNVFRDEGRLQRKARYYSDRGHLKIEEGET